MGADQQFCLRWNNFHTNITSAFESLRDDEDFVDITLACEGRQVKAHKMVLSACSPYFRSLLKGNPCQHPIVFLKDVTFANLASILDFMYHGEVNVSHNELATFLKTAEALKVRGLAEDDKRKDSDGYVDASSPGPPRDPPDPGSPRPDETSATDTHLSDSPPPHKKRRRSGTSIQSAEDTNETVLSEIRETSVKNEPQEFNDEDDMLGHSVDTSDIKADNVSVSAAGGGNDDSEERSNFGISESVSISRSQAAMQQLQESFGSFLPAMSQSSGFLPHGATDMPRPPFPLEGVQGLPPGISALPGPSMSQAGASQDTSQGEGDKESLDCTFCGKNCSSRYNLKKHVRDIHLNKGNKFTCQQCNRTYSSLNSLQVHRSVTHPTGNRRRHNQGSGSRRRSSTSRPYDENTLDLDTSQEELRDEYDIEEEEEQQQNQMHQGIHSTESRAKRDLLPTKLVDPLMNVQSVSQQTHVRTPQCQEAHSSRDLRISNQSHNLSPQVHTPISPQLHSQISPQLNTSMSPQLHTSTSPQQPQPAHQSMYHHTMSHSGNIHSPVSSQRPLSLTSHASKTSKPYDLHPQSYSPHMNNPVHTFHQASGTQHTGSQYRLHSPHSYSPVVSPYESGERTYPQADSEDVPSNLMHSLNIFNKKIM